MKLNFTEPGKCKIKQFWHVSELLDEWPEPSKENKIALTPASNSLFEKGDGIIRAVGGL